MKLRLSSRYGLLFVVFFAHAIFYFCALGADAVDDAYISFRYAQNARRGYGLVFNPGERVEGFTNFLWTALTIPLEAAQVDTGRASMLLGALCGLATIWLVVRFAQTAGAPRGVGWLAAFLLAADGSFVLWAVSGLETPLFTFLIFAGALFYIREQDEQPSTNDEPAPFVLRLGASLARSGIFFALAALTRPEGLFVCALTVAHQAAWRILTERRLWVARDLARILAFAALFAPYWLARWGYYKSFLPNTFHAKVAAAGPAAQIERGWKHLAQFIGVHLGWLIALPPIIALLSAVRSAVSGRRLFWITYFAALIIPYSAYIVYVGGDWSVGRFFAPLLPFFYLLCAMGLKEARQIIPARAPRIEWFAAACLVGAIFFASSFNGEYGIYIRSFEAGRATQARVTMGRWLKAHAPRGTLIAVDAAGQVPYFSELPAIDMFGINDLHIGRLQVATLGQGTPGHEKFDLIYVILRQPEYVIIFGTLLDSVKEYERAPVEWTDDPALQKFLTLYRRKR